MVLACWPSGFIGDGLGGLAHLDLLQATCLLPKEKALVGVTWMDCLATAECLEAEGSVAGAWLDYDLRRAWLSFAAREPPTYFEGMSFAPSAYPSEILP